MQENIDKVESHRVLTGHEMAKALRTVKGAVYVSVNNRHGNIYVQCVKSDLIASMENYADEVCGFELHMSSGNWYFDIDYYA